MFSIRKYYDVLERNGIAPESMLSYGTGSWDYLAEVKPDAVTFVAELGYVHHPDDGSQKLVGENLRKFKLRIDADSKYLATVLLEEWDKTREQLNQDHPLYRTVVSGRAFPTREKLAEGPMPLSRYPTRDILFNPDYDRSMTEGDRFNACMTDGGFFFLLFASQFVRLLEASPRTTTISSSIERLEGVFAEARKELGQLVDFGRFSAINYDQLTRIQLGSGLIALNSLLEERNN
jgi:hypothetical protein